MKKNQTYISLKKGNSSLILLLFFVVSTLFITGCTKNDTNTDSILNQRSHTFPLNTTNGNLIISVSIKKETKNGSTTWSGNASIANVSNSSILFTLPYKSSIVFGSSYKHTFEDTKSNKITLTTDMNLGNAEVINSESSLTGYTFL